MVSVNVQPGTVAVPEWLNARFPIERDAVITRATDIKPRQWRTVKINSLLLNPRDAELYRTSLMFAKRFVADMAKQGFGLLTNESDLLITGPYPHLESDTGRHADGRQKAIGRHFGQEQEEQWADFRITGQFLRSQPLTFEYRD